MTEPGITPYHAKYFAHVLTARAPSDDLGKLGASIFDATVDLNPHQLDAALFAFRSPLSRGAILADEVGLGKTIEAGLVISQLWAERRRRILVITPTILRKQWAQELEDKFFLKSRVLDSRDYNLARKQGRDPLLADDEVVICSYNFAASREGEFAAVKWDLVVIDEAHRLRNVWKPTNKISNALHRAVSSKPLLLLTATPLQNSLLELYGLVSFLDEHVFGSIEAFKMRYMRGPIEERDLYDLRSRMRPICQRTLRRQVQEYVRFTNRIPLTQDFTPTPDEQRLYDEVSEFLRRPNLHALPASQRPLMTLILRKLLASSSFAISGTLTALADRLEKESGDLQSVVAEDYDGLDETAEEWSEAPVESPHEQPVSNSEIDAEITELRNFGALADSILKNAKGDALIVALNHGFEKMAQLGAPRKAVIFTESRRTQDYLVALLNSNGFAGRVLTINGTNSDDRSGEIYKEWRARHSGESFVTGNKAVDLRAALVDHFRNQADILIATEAASEGVNLQFCSLVINFDLPWNPQRIEQRIGRCHRYGQAHDVVVVNFLNRENEADKRVFELLDKKFKLFDGVFGSSDEVLGALESGVDFEKRIAGIYQTCRTRAEIDSAFDRLRNDLDDEIQSRMVDTRTKLLENFDEDVRKRLKVSLEESETQLDKMERALWAVARAGLKNEAEFDDEVFQFTLNSVPEYAPSVSKGRYHFARRAGEGAGEHRFRLGDDLAQGLLKDAAEMELPSAELQFKYTGCGRKIGLLDPLVGKSGWLQISKLTVSSLDQEDYVLAAVVAEDGVAYHSDVADAMFRLNAEQSPASPSANCQAERLAAQMAIVQRQAVAHSQDRNRKYFEDELEKLDRWADDLKNNLQVELKDLEATIKRLKKEVNLAATLQEKLDFVREQKSAESLRNKKRRELYEAEDEIEIQKDQIIETVAARLKQETHNEDILQVRWELD